MRGKRHYAGELGATAERQMSELADQALLELVRDGDERAFEALVLRYGRPLRSYCMRLGVPAHSTEDVVQQALLEAWLALRGGAQVHAFKAWLYRVVHNIALDAIRKNPRVMELASGEAEQAAAPMPSEMLGSDLRETLSAVASLPLLQREAIVRTVLAGESHEQVGRYLGLTAGAVRGLVYRGRATLRSALAALVPPWLPRLLASRSSAASGLRESLSGIATSAGSTGSAGALVKAGVIMAVAATAITATLPGHTTRTGTHRPAGPAPANGSSLAPEASPSSKLAQERGNPRAHATVASRAAGPTPTRDKSISRRPTGTHGAGSQPAASGPATGSTGAGQAQPQAGQSPAGGAAGASAEASSAGASSSQPEGGVSAPTEAPTGSGTQPAGGSGSTGSEQSPPTSGSSGSSSSESGGLVGEVVHTAEKTLETTLEDTLGGLLHH